MKKPSATELMEGLAALNTKKEIQEFLRGQLIEDGKPIVNKNDCTKYAQQLRKIDASMLPGAVQYVVETKEGRKIQHYAVKVIYDIQKDLIEGKTQTTQQKAAASQSHGKHSINVLDVFETAKECIQSKNWREKLIGCQILTGRRLGAIAYEASFEPINPALLRVFSGQKKRGNLSECTFPTLIDSQTVLEAIESVREGIQKDHATVYERWLEDPSSQNAHKFTNSINASVRWKAALDKFVAPLFKNHPKNTSHDLRGVYGAIMWKCHEELTGSANPGHFVQMILDHDSIGVTQTYLAYRLAGITELLESVSDEFCKAMDAATYEKLEKTYMPFDVETFLTAISDDSARTEVAAMLTDSESFAAKLGREFDRLYQSVRQLQQQSRPRVDSASARIESVIQAIMNYNISQQGTNESDRAYARISTPLINAVGKLIYNTTFDTRTLAEVVGGIIKGEQIKGLMEDEIAKHHEKLEIPENQNLKYRKGKIKMDEIVQNIAAQHG
jgi:hypothetical protein